ncbi:MAG: DNRLRE domain-containing protein [Kiritimatiellae bacterium]|nr:DNRLRE domain-containing protein [Kiritimatiellia bacterium]
MKIQSKNMLFLSVCTLAVWTTPATALLIDAVEDTYVWTANPDSIYGSSSVIVVANDGGSAISKGKDRNGIIEFDISTVTNLITGIELLLTSEGFSRDYQLYGIPDTATDESFDQDTLTFNTFQYSTTSENGSLDTDSLLDLGGFTTSSTSVNFSSAALLSFVQNDTNDTVSFVLYGLTQDGNDEEFNSIESGSGIPQLNITTIPEPSSLALIGLTMIAGVGLLRKRR